MNNIPRKGTSIGEPVNCKAIDRLSMPEWYSGQPLSREKLSEIMEGRFSEKKRNGFTALRYSVVE
ncbi:hypothetical protein T265_11975 [Opisthorchis viverrini]|uniref:Uncharacterized protein n=1 Tax=Opisthorchis viverrini TaxID=6198 RepID=A0A074YWN0_OPIVI|nr:hypothetical protein T265_11975 [Opisthorchis viverrini]KER19156.1 hypothetical protein T265_11975 [Opisthorchis viverrini]